MEEPGLRGVYANGSANTGPTKEAGGAESPKPDTDAQWVQNCGLKSQKFRTRDPKMKQSPTSYQRAGTSGIPDAPAQNHLSGDTQNQRILEPASPKHQNSEGVGLLPQAAPFLAVSCPAEVTPRLTLNAPHQEPNPLSMCGCITGMPHTSSQQPHLGIQLLLAHLL